MKVTVLFKAHDVTTDEELTAEHEFQIESEEHLAKQVSQTLFAIGQTGFVRKTGPNTWRLVLPTQLRGVTAEASSIHVVNTIPAGGGVG